LRGCRARTTTRAHNDDDDDDEDGDEDGDEGGDDDGGDGGDGASVWTTTRARASSSA